MNRCLSVNLRAVGQPDLRLFLCLTLYPRTPFLPPARPLLVWLSNLECPEMFAEHLLQARRCSGLWEYKDEFSRPLSCSPTSAHQISSKLQACLRHHFV